MQVWRLSFWQYLCILLLCMSPLSDSSRRKLKSPYRRQDYNYNDDNFFTGGLVHNQYDNAEYVCGHEHEIGRGNGHELGYGDGHEVGHGHWDELGHGDGHELGHVDGHELGHVDGHELGHGDGDDIEHGHKLEHGSCEESSCGSNIRHCPHGCTFNSYLCGGGFSYDECCC